MKPRVIDASVVATAFFHEPDAGAANALLQSDAELHAPDLIHAELANIIWKRHRRSEITDSEAADLLADFLHLPLRITPCSDLAQMALQFALQTGCTAYDCLYLALAVRCEGALITSDRRLVNTLAHSPLQGHVAWIGSYRRK